LVLSNFRNQYQYAVGTQQQYVSLFACGMFGIARVGGFQAGSQTLANHYSISPYNAIYDTAGLSIGELQSSFKTMLGMIGSF